MKNKGHILKIVGFDMLVIEFGPVGIFFLTYHFTDFGTAALALALATLTTLVLSKVINKRIPWFALFSGSVTITTAFLTYLYDAPWVLIARDSVYYSLFALFLGISVYRGKSVFKAFFGHVFLIADEGWKSLEKRWLGFFLFAALTNEYVRMFMTVEQWVWYKQIMLVLFVVFGFMQFGVTIRHRLPGSDKLGLNRVGAKAEKQPEG